MPEKLRYPVFSLLLALALCPLISACGKHAAQGAGRGATTGAVSGAVGGLVSALVFGGDPLERAARGVLSWAAQSAQLQAP